MSFLFCFFFSSKTAFATTYYVDNTGGSDSNNGTSTGTAWQTLTKVNNSMSGATIVAGDTINFKRGETFTGNLVVSVSGSINNLLTFDAYGSGNKPIISASGNTHGIDIRTNKSYITLQNLKIQSATNQIFFNSSVSNMVIDQVDVEGGTRGIYLNTGTFSNIQISNVSLSGFSSMGIRMQGTTFTNIDISNATSTSGGQEGIDLSTGDYSDISISDSVLSSHSVSGIRVIPTSLSDLTITDTITNSNANYGVYIFGVVSDINIDNLTANTNGGSDSIYSGILFSNDGVSPTTNINVSNSTFNSNGGNGFTIRGMGEDATVTDTTSANNRQDGFNVHTDWTNIVFDGCIADTNGVTGLGSDGDGFSFHDDTAGIIKNSIAKNNLKSAVSNIDTSAVDIYYNLFYHTTNGTQPLVYFTDSSGIYNLYNNVIYSAGSTGTGLENNGSTVTIKNNIVMGFNYGIVQTSGTMTEENNILYGAATNNWSGLTKGAHSFSSNPSFENESARDFRLLVTSPAINAGTDVGLTSDFAGNPIIGIVDIGAYEYQLSIPPPSVPSPSSCGNSAPVGQADLFQINRSGKDAKLYFTPVNSVNAYAVIFGFTENDERFGSLSEMAENGNNGVQSINIHQLNPRTDYWFKVVPISGCAAGTWSNWLKAGRIVNTTSIFYRYFSKL